LNLSLLDSNLGYQNLLADLKSGLINHAYLIVSLDENLRKTAFTKFITSYFCPSSCQTCTACKKIASNNHISVKVLDGKNKIRVSDINELAEDTHILPIEGDRKFYFIDNANLLDPRAQNKLLKTYEEPPKYVTIFLGVSNEAGLLSTIKSRGKHIFLEPLTSRAIYNELVELGYDEIVSQEAASYAMGSLEKAMLFVGDQNYKYVYEETFNTLISLKNSSQIIDHLYKDIFSKENILLSLEFLEIFLSDIMKIIAKSNIDLLTLNRDYDLNLLAKSFTLAGASMALNAINDARERLKFNVSSTSVAEKVMFDLLEARYKWQ